MMGAGNVKLVVNAWSPHLDDRPFRALVQMAVVSLDDGNPPRYWDGWAPIARAVGAAFPPSCADGKHAGKSLTSAGTGKVITGRCVECASAQRAASRAIAQLSAAGALRLTGRGRPGRNAEYSLLLTELPTGPRTKRYGDGSQLKDTRLRESRDTRDSESRVTSSTRDSESRVNTRLRESPTRDSESRAEEKQEQVVGVTPSPVAEQAALDVVTPDGATVPPRGTLDDHFADFWASYPRKVGKSDARKAWDKARKQTHIAVILAGVRRLAADPNLPSDRKFIPHPSTWLNRGGWDDEPYPGPAGSTPSSLDRAVPRQVAPPAHDPFAMATARKDTP